MILAYHLYYTKFKLCYYKFLLKIIMLGLKSNYVKKNSNSLTKKLFNRPESVRLINEMVTKWKKLVTF